MALIATDSKSAPSRWVVVAVLLTPPLVALLLIELARTSMREPQSSDAVARLKYTVASPAKPKLDPQCIRIAPSSFGVGRSGLQELTAVFWGSVGTTQFTWSADGGAFGEIGEAPTRATIDGYLIGDEFEGDRLDSKLWRAVVPDGASLVQNGGVLTLKHPGGKGRDPDPGIRLESVFVLRGNFELELTIIDVEADGMSGVAALSLRTEDGFEPRLRRIAHTAVRTIEANTSNPNRSSQATTSVFDPGGPAKLRLVRAGSSVSYQAELGGGGVTQLGSRLNPISAAPAKVVITGASSDEFPAINAIVDNLMVAQNIRVAWRAPADAAIDTLYTIRLNNACQATARIIE